MFVESEAVALTVTVADAIAETEALSDAEAEWLVEWLVEAVWVRSHVIKNDPKRT